MEKQLCQKVKSRVIEEPGQRQTIYRANLKILYVDILNTKYFGMWKQTRNEIIQKTSINDKD